MCIRDRLRWTRRGGLRTGPRRLAVGQQGRRSGGRRPLRPVRWSLARPFGRSRHPAAGRFYLEDMRSTNGTLLNDSPVTGEVELADGDRIAIGDTELRFEGG